MPIWPIGRPYIYETANFHIGYTRNILRLDPITLAYRLVDNFWNCHHSSFLQAQASFLLATRHLQNFSLAIIGIVQVDLSTGQIIVEMAQALSDQGLVINPKETIRFRGES